VDCYGSAWAGAPSEPARRPISSDLLRTSLCLARVCVPVSHSWCRARVCVGGFSRRPFHIMDRNRSPRPSFARRMQDLGIRRMGGSVGQPPYPTLRPWRPTPAATAAPSRSSSSSSSSSSRLASSRSRVQPSPQATDDSPMRLTLPWNDSEPEAGPEDEMDVSVSQEAQAPSTPQSPLNWLTDTMVAGEIEWQDAQPPSPISISSESPASA
jgi:hypothetical protein